eukprot:g6993.t1
MPNIEKLANHSVYFDSFYVHPVCAPTRASLFTGRNFLRTGVWGVHGARDYIHLSEQTFGDILRTNGYHTGLFGKWHNGLTDGYLPWHRGFQEACMVDLYSYIDNNMLCNGVEVQTQGWATARIADRVLDFISRKRSSPFAVVVPFMAPHLGKTYPAQDEYWHAPTPIVKKYKNKGLSHQLSRLYAMIDFMDVQIGRVLTALEDLGLTENTVVIFFSDNGPIGKRLMSEEDWSRRNSHHLRGNKGEIYENGIRVPLFVSWPSMIPRSTRSSALTTVEDIFPTIMDLVGVNSTRNLIDGWSLVPLLLHPEEPHKSWKTRTLFFTKAAPDWTKQGGVYQVLPDQGRNKSQLIYGHQGSWAIRQGSLKFISHYGNKELFDLSSDPMESNDINNNALKQFMQHEAVKKWNALVAENHSFQLPVFFIGWSPVSKFYLMGAVETSSDVKVRSHSIRGMLSAGSYAKYRVIVAAAGNYTVNIQEWSSFMGQISLQVSCGDQNAYMNGYLAQEFLGSIEIPFEDNICILEMKVESGDGWFQAQTMTLTKVP